MNLEKVFFSFQGKSNSFLTKKLRAIADDIPTTLKLKDITVGKYYEIVDLKIITVEGRQAVILTLQENLKKFQVFIPDVFQEVFLDKNNQKKLIEEEHFVVVESFKSGLPIINIVQK